MKSREELEDALRRAINIIELLAEQQAMEDDWYLDELREIEKVLE
jgi:hypothetical protein